MHLLRCVHLLYRRAWLIQDCTQLLLVLKQMFLSLDMPCLDQTKHVNNSDLVNKISYIADHI